MELMHERCAGMDISKRDAKVCVRAPGARRGTYRKEISTHGAMRRDIAALGDHLVSQGVTLVVLEATGDYWKPFYYGLADRLNLMLVNARHAKNMPGRKTDVSDAQWLTELGAYGLVRGSFVPPEPVQRLRDLTRQRTLLTRQKTREIQQLEKLVESTGIKYTSVATRTLGLSGRAFLDALVAGETSPLILASLAKGRLKSKTSELRLALDGNFTTHHGDLVKLHLDRVDMLDRHIAVLTTSIDVLILDEDMAWARELLATVPGISAAAAENVIAEIGVDMGVFETSAHLASWAGVCPGQHESAGRRGPATTRHGNAYLKGALGVAAMSAIRTKDSFYQDRYRRLAARRGNARALVAVEHSLLVAIWHILTNREPHRPHHRAA